MTKGFIVFNVISFIIFITILIISFGVFGLEDVGYLFSNSNWTNPVGGKNFTPLLLKAFSLLGLLIQFYIVNKKLSEL